MVRMSIAAEFLVDRSEAPYMGEVTVSVYIENASERAFAERGLWGADKVKSVSLEMIVDTGATLVALPEAIVRRLALARSYKRESRLADGTTIDSWVVSGATILLDGRKCTVDCVVVPDGSPALLGQIPLEQMDLLVDCFRRRLVGRHEAGPLISL